MVHGIFFFLDRTSPRLSFQSSESLERGDERHCKDQGTCDKEAGCFALKPLSRQPVATWPIGISAPHLVNESPLTESSYFNVYLIRCWYKD